MIKKILTFFLVFILSLSTFSSYSIANDLQSDIFEEEIVEKLENVQLLETGVFSL